MSALADSYGVTTTVNNTIAVTNGVALTLGTLAITQGTSAGVQATFTLNTDGTTDIVNNGAGIDASIVDLGGAAAGEFSVSSLGAFASINVATATKTGITATDAAVGADAAAELLVNSLAPPSTRADLLITALLIDPGTGTQATMAAGDGTTPGAATVVTADVGGNASWNIGMTVSTVQPAAATNEYYDGSYSGSYDITVSY
jgi:hypothetical protein